MSTTLNAAPVRLAPAAPFRLQGLFGALSTVARSTAGWMEALAREERLQHVAQAVDHEDLARRERDCAEFERRCALMPRCH